MNRANKRRQKYLTKKAAKAKGGAPGNNLQDLIQKGIQAHQAGKLPEASAIYQQILDIEPDQADANHLLGTLAYQTGNHETASQLISKAIRTNPAVADYHCNLGNALKGLGRRDDAVDSYNKAIILNPDLAVAHNNLGNTLQDLGQSDEAVASYRKALHIDPDYAEAHSNLADTFRELGLLDDAVASCHKSLAINPDYAEAHGNLGAALQELKRLDEAVASYEKALAINPNLAKVENNLGCMLFELGKLEEAVARFHKALAIKPDYAEAHGHLGNTLKKQGRLDEAVASYRRALDIDPGRQDLSHFISSINGETTDIAPEKYIRELFDRYAGKFDDHLTNDLGYKIPALMRQAVDSLPDGPETFPLALDLGCGTGMAAENFRDRVGEIDGVDLSPKMLEQAEAKGIYANLYLTDVLEFLEGPDARPGGYDLILSADTFVYIGKLDGIFAAARRALSDGGLFVFSVEHLEDGDFKLLPSSRYSQSDAYIEKLAAESSLAVVCNDPVVGRTEKKTPIPGRIFVLRAAA